MWHEEQYEMQALITSLFCLFSEHQKLGLNYYTLETHIFIDDAFDESMDELNENKCFVINSYVKDLIDITKQTNREFGYKTISISMTDTPYGQQIHFQLSIDYKLIAHLKNRNLIRKGKRWSQVMYMNLVKAYVRDLNLNAEDIMLIALDGDTSYPPESMFSLIESAINNPKIGAISGRLIPISKYRFNWIVMYQKFEYSVSYWLQKTVENIWGSILCSPGCFTLYRAEAVFDTMDEYSTQSYDAFTQILFGQGEDRWLTTLLLKSGWLIEYCSEARAYTHSPTTMDEYIKQRLRWIASTMINNLHLILISNEVTKHSQNVSWIFIGYHSAIFLISILTPGSVVLMLSGVYNSSFPVSELIGFSLNLSVFIIFCLICFLMQNKWQILVMKSLGAVYGLTMIAVLVSTIYQFITDSYHSPTFVIFAAIVGVFTVAVLLHPSDLLMSASVMPALIYFACGPAMNFLLPLYSLINMDVVSWGTREKSKTPELSDNSQAFDSNSQLKSDYNFQKSKLNSIESNLWISLVSNGNGVLNPNQDKSQTQEVKTFRQNLMRKQRNKYALILITINLIFILSIISIELLLKSKMLSIVIPLVNYSLSVDPTALTVFVVIFFFFVFQFSSLLIHRYKTLWNYIKDEPTVHYSHPTVHLTQSSDNITLINVTHYELNTKF